ncbi:MAG TPA: SlyX family protein [Treponemataceae bacterium]|nr:SlyX family protein [Treponemataceae bacterium]HPS43704.1 SlyX family protein [Treponemataceae bacterium]
MDTTNERITRIETKLAYLEDFMAKLQSITVEHTEALDHLKGENRALREKLGELSDSLQDIPNVRPPHY